VHAEADECGDGGEGDRPEERVECEAVRPARVGKGSQYS
jgi:hypothetical protein